MRAVVTRVSKSLLWIDGSVHAEIGQGLLVLVGVKEGDGEREAVYLAEKCANLRIFEDESGKMNKSVYDVGGGIMAISNFTLYADCARGRRPDFFHAAKPDVAIPVYDFFLKQLKRLEVPHCAGIFGADMKIEHINDGPVTIIMDTEQMLRGVSKSTK